MRLGPRACVGATVAACAVLGYRGFPIRSGSDTEIEVLFTIARRELTDTRRFEHRRLDRYGDSRDEMRTIFDKTGDWGQLLASFAQPQQLR